MNETEEVYPVIGPSGAIYELQAEEEVNQYNDIMRRYLDDNIFKNMSDLMELDRILNLEIMVWRWSNWLFTDRDYTGSAIDPESMAKLIKGNSTEIRLIKAGLGIDKASRDKDKGSNFAEWVDQLLRRAKEFGYHREKQLEQALILFNELDALLTLHRNTTEDEQKEMHCTQVDVFKWLYEVCIPEYHQIDEYFKENQQRFWVKDL